MNATNMTHPQLVRALAKPGADIQATATAHRLDLLHMAVGICTEAGELLDAVKKVVIYDQEPDMANFDEELGDLEFYMEGLRQNLGIKREDTVAHNIEKLSKRYHELRYSDRQAKERADKLKG